MIIYESVGNSVSIPDQTYTQGLKKFLPLYLWSNICKLLDLRIFLD